MSFALAIPLIGKVIERIFPDPTQQAEAKLKVLELQQSGDLAELEAETKLAFGQIEVNREEAKSGSLFVSGWRPAVGWICAAGVGWNFIIQPLMKWAAFALGADLVDAPELDIGDLMVLLGGMLGLGTLRTAEKIKDVARAKL